MTATARGRVLDCGLLLACAALLRLTSSLCLQVHYSCMLGVGRRELRRCLCICVKEFNMERVEIVRITLGNYHVEQRDCGSYVFIWHCSQIACLWSCDLGQAQLWCKDILANMRYTSSEII